MSEDIGNQFVILRHDPPVGGSRPLHWDLMLEEDESLRTWALSAPPGPAVEITAEDLPHHRKAYLQYEGPISGDRGSVSRWDEGTFHWIERSDELVVVQLAGRRWRGTLRIEKSDSTDHRWIAVVASDSR